MEVNDKQRQLDLRDVLEDVSPTKRILQVTMNFKGCIFILIIMRFSRPTHEVCLGLMFNDCQDK